MSGTALILHIQPGADFNAKTQQLLASKLSCMTHRTVSDADSLAAALQEQEWGAILYDQDVSRRELSSHLELIREEERKRIAREIHDGIGTLLTALKMDLAWLAARMPSDDSALHKKTQGMNELLDSAGNLANELIHQLRPGQLDCFGIVATLETEAQTFANRTGIPCEFIKSGDHLEIADEQSIALLRVFQETLNNIMKHASARHVQVRIQKDTTGTALTVSDDGCGFTEASGNKSRSFGLRGIKERIRQLGGQVTISSKPDKGTTVSVHLPNIVAHPQG